jgi:methionyl-tRNA synthetase
VKVFIGVAWPYASGPRHLGHLAGAYLPADIVARYHRLAGDEVLMASGSDQHGTPITVAAEAAGEPPTAFSERQHQVIKASFDRIGISFDHYTRTGTDTHRRVGQNVFEDLNRAGWVFADTAEAAFCTAEGRSLPDRYVIGSCPHCGYTDARGDQCDGCGRTLDPVELVSPRCRRCGRKAAFAPLRQLFLALDRLQPQLTLWVRNAAPNWRRFVAEETAGILAGGLRSRAITRDLDWGVPVPLPGWDDRRLYVWFDAVIGYRSASEEWATGRGQPDAWREWWEDPEVRHIYFIGKDNLFFHTLFWPAILTGAGQGWHLPDDVVANHHLTLAGAQMSSSRGHGFGLDEAVDRLGVDPLRHALAAQNPESADTEFSYRNALEATRTGLLGAIANPAYRVASLLWQRVGGRVDPAVWASAGAERAHATHLLEEIGESLRRARLRHGLSLVHQLGRTINRALAETEPWKLPDSEVANVLAPLLVYVDAIGVAAWPFVPGTAESVRSMSGRPGRPTAWALEETPPVMNGPPAPPLPSQSG